MVGLVADTTSAPLVKPIPVAPTGPVFRRALASVIRPKGSRIPSVEFSVLDEEMMRSHWSQCYGIAAVLLTTWLADGMDIKIDATYPHTDIYIYIVKYSRFTTFNTVATRLLALCILWRFVSGASRVRKWMVEWLHWLVEVYLVNPC